ncbi:MAG: FecR domain-containing protein [Acidobacteriaceae bacterium]|nr:FecR domain-containing protein [Acidobacteriaceae bacterium]MBV9294780.1 FecR domain-containing protein [Acidobacteriaceae bacterium]MBV9767106.1 FecR domain-containing protein [Acidobacteriaceae bacterium]
MNEEYLWNREGEADPDIARLEGLLQPLQYQPDRSVLPQKVLKAVPARRRVWVWASALAAAAMVVLAITWRVGFREAGLTGESAWKVSWNNSTPQATHGGQVIDTGERSAARLESDFIGEVRVDPQSRLRLLRSTKDEQRLALEHGTIHAFIWAPPREFVVDTPSATTVDLGCRYTLHVAPDGTGSLHVEMGWVAFQWRDLESFIPAGAACTTRPERGPGTPYFSDAAPELKTAVFQFDNRHDVKALETILHSARPQDALTVWHLLSRTKGAERGEVFARFSELVKLPPTITREKILSGDPAALDAAWNALDFGDTDWWREWKRRW